MDMNERIISVTLTKACSVKPDKDSMESKVINLRVRFDGATVGDVFAKAVSSAVISWQNGQGRKSFDVLKNNQTVDIQFASPAARPMVDPETAMVEKLRSMSPEQAKVELERLYNLSIQHLEVTTQKSKRKL